MVPISAPARLLYRPPVRSSVARAVRAGRTRPDDDPEPVRVQRERLDNVALKHGQPNDPQLPDASFDRVPMIHMYHEIQQPSEFLWHLHDERKRGGAIIVVDADRSTDRHGTPPQLLVCAFNAVGYALKRFERLPASDSYFASFEPRGPKPQPNEIPACTL